MKKQRNLVSKLIAMLVFSVIVINACLSEVTAKAATIYELSASEINIAVGRSQILRISGLNTPNSVVWSVEDKTIATVSNGTVKGVKIGDTVVTAKIGKVKLKCKVHVKWPNQDSLPYMKNISISLPTDEVVNRLIGGQGASWKVDKNQFVYMIQNNNEFPVTIKAQRYFMGKNYHDAGYGNPVSITIPANDYEFLIFDDTNKPENISSSGYYIISVKKSKTKFIETKITVSDKKLDEENELATAPIKLTVKNSTGKEVKKFKAYVVYYDKYSSYCLGVDKITGKLKKGTNEFTTNPSKYSGTAEDFKDAYYKIYYNAY